jgi:hypothetical protein
MRPEAVRAIERLQGLEGAIVDSPTGAGESGRIELPWVRLPVVTLAFPHTGHRVVLVRYGAPTSIVCYWPIHHHHSP